MLNLSKFASNVLNSIDNAAKESLEEPKELTATQIRSQRRSQKALGSLTAEDLDVHDRTKGGSQATVA
jgi:hypothetical protein